ncbi:hypothetical protein AAVH_33914 [Aphelenchoides avenae]|nr:hypothetical protein AAVH_33914 [Aphelenchus avenae]
MYNGVATFDDLDVDEFVAAGEKHPSDSGVSYVWQFRFDDLPELNVEYKSCYLPQPPSHDDRENADLRCWGTIRGSARGL